MPLARFIPAAVLVLTSITASAQVMGYPGYNPSTPNPDDSKRYTLSGTVVNSVTGQPIRRALVNLSYMQQFATMTDSDGRFEFDGLPQGSLMVTAQKPGFFSEQELPGFRRPQFADIGPEAAPTTIKLVPEAIITGRILDPDGLPVARLTVRALTQNVVNGRKQWQSGTIAYTDDDGNYRISNLKPGSYFLIAGPGRALAFVARSGGDLGGEMGYPAVLYPGLNSPVKLGAGQKTELDFSVKPEPFYTVSGSVTGIPPGQRCSVQLIPQLPGVQMPVAFAQTDAESGAFTMQRVAGGDYVIQAQSSDPQGNRLFSSTQIGVTRNMMGLRIAMEPAMTIPVRIRMERTRPGPQIPPGARFMGAQVRLIPVDDRRQEAWSGFENPKDPTSPVVLRNALPGTYRAEITPNFGDMYVQSATFGTTDLLNSNLTLIRSASQSSIDIVLRDDGAHLTVKIPAQQRQENVNILLVPERGEPRLMTGYGDQNGGGTQITGLRPGSYTVLAFQDLGDLEYMNRAALEPYLSRGAKITLATNQEATVTTDLIKPRGE
jgi:hypothetical protein